MRSARTIHRAERHAQSFCTVASPAAKVDIQTLDYDSVKQIKETRFGRQLEEYKRIYEEPLCEAYNTVNLIKSTYANRQARYMMKGKRKVKTKATDRVTVSKQLTINEKKLEGALHSYLKRDLDVTKEANLFMGRTKLERKRRESLLRAFMTNERFRELPNENMDPLEIHMTQVPAHTNQSDMSEQWEAETQMEPNELAAVVAKEVEARGFPISTNWADRFHDQRDRKFSNPREHVVAVLATNNTGYLPGDRVPNRPALLKPTRVLRSHKNKFKRMHKVSKRYPIGFESSHYPLDADMYDPYIVRKCTLYCKLHSLGLPKVVRTRLLHLAGHLYNPRKDLLILKSQKKRTFPENKRYVVAILNALLREAWKADLNFVPSLPDRLLPHQIIEQEIKRGATADADRHHQSFNSIAEVTNFTAFQITAFPEADDQILDKRTKINQLLEQLNQE